MTFICENPGFLEGAATFSARPDVTTADDLSITILIHGVK
jgi:hypothetical protein